MNKYHGKKYGEYALYDFQGDVVSNTLSHIRDQFKSFNNKKNIDHAYINASVSSGKSLMMAAISDHCTGVGINSMILTAVGELALQDGETCWDAGVKCSYFSAYVGRKSTHFPVIAATVGSVANALNDQFKDYKLHVLQIDECHNTPFDNPDSDFMKVINHFRAINPMLIVIGWSGTPWRDGCSITGDFWKKQIEPAIDRQFLVGNGFTHPDTFGYTENSDAYDLGDDLKVETNEFSTTDYSDNQLSKMHDKMNRSDTDHIMEDVVRISNDRNGVLIVCAGSSHCKEVSESLSDSTWAIVTSKDGVTTNTEFTKRKDAVAAFKAGKIKYLINIGIFLVGFNAPILDTIVILRRIGSIVLFEQTLGRGRRLLKKEQLEAGIVKNDSLVLDFSGTVASLYQQYENPVLEEAMKKKAAFERSFQDCPLCGELNGEYARRCCNDTCDHWFQFRVCDDLLRNGQLVSKGCGEKCDIAAKECKCGNMLVDPNANLQRQHYSAEDFKPVLKMTIEVAGKSQDAIKVCYFLDVFDETGKQEIATLVFWAINQGGKRTWTSNFVRRHITGYPYQQKMLAMKPFQVVTMKAMFGIPTHITHRVGAKGSIVHGLRFNNGKTLKGDKRVADEVIA